MRNITRLLFAVTVLISTTLAASAQSDWKGTYSFHEDGGRNAGGTAIFISHQLTIFDGDDGLVATLESNGYQTSKDLMCKAKVVGSKLHIYFESYGEDNVFESFQPGDLLLTLERKAAKGRDIILTHWGKFTPSVPKNERSGREYFQKETK